MAVIRKVKLQKDCYQSVMKATTKMLVIMTDLGLCRIEMCYSRPMKNRSGSYNRT